MEASTISSALRRISHVCQQNTLQLLTTGTVLTIIKCTRDLWASNVTHCLWLQPRGGWWRYYELCIHMNWGDCIVLYDHMGFTRPCVGCTLFSCHLSWHCTQHKKQQYIVFNPSCFFFFLASEGIVVMLLSLLYLFQFYKMSLFTIPSCLHCTLEALHNGSFFDRVDQSIRGDYWLSLFYFLLRCVLFIVQPYALFCKRFPNRRILVDLIDSCVLFYADLQGELNQHLQQFTP